MKMSAGLLWLAGLLAGLLGSAAAADPAIAVIVHPDTQLQALDTEELANIFRLKIRIDDRGTRLVPVNLPGSDPLRILFSRLLFKLEPEDMEAYWNERYFHGISPPHVVASTEAMLRFVAATEGAVGYVLDCQVDERVRVVLTVPVPGGADALAPPCPSPRPGSAAALRNLQTKLAH